VSSVDRVTVSLIDGVADVQLNRPDKRNALDPAMFEALVATGERLKTETGLRVVVLSGNGPDFCAGLDFASFEAMRAGDRTPAPAQLPPPDGPAWDVAKELTFTARIVTGAEAVRIGLATRAEPDPRTAARAMAAEIAARSPHAIRAAKRLLNLAGRVDLESGLAAEQQEIRALVGSPNQAEAVTARFERRNPVFADV
jgi:enoyl-CoA hydratase/carnithine racemase